MFSKAGKLLVTGLYIYIYIINTRWSRYGLSLGKNKKCQIVLGNLGGRTLVTPRVPLQPCLGSLVCLQPLQHLQQFDLDRLCGEEHGTALSAGAISTSEFHLHQQSAPRLEIFKLILMAAGQVWARYGPGMLGFYLSQQMR